MQQKISNMMGINTFIEKYKSGQKEFKNVHILGRCKKEDVLNRELSLDDLRLENCIWESGSEEVSFCFKNFSFYNITMSLGDTCFFLLDEGIITNSSIEDTEINNHFEIRESELENVIFDKLKTSRNDHNYFLDNRLNNVQFSYSDISLQFLYCTMFNTKFQFSDIGNSRISYSILSGCEFPCIKGLETVKGLETSAIINAQYLTPEQKLFIIEQKRKADSNMFN